MTTVRISITDDEYSVLKPGLDHLVNGLATARQGAFPHRHPYHRIDIVASDVYRNQAYDDSIAAMLIQVRAKLSAPSRPRRLYLTFIDLSILAFALRQLRKTDLNAFKKSGEIVPLLSHKLEKHRKRAKRRIIARLGKSAYDDAAERWRGFSDWAQYNLLYFKLPRRGTPILKELWRNKRVQMTELIRVTAKQRYDLDLTEAQVDGICRLVIPSLRRRRHDLTLNMVLSGSDAAKDFLIAFITKRVPLDKGPNAPLTHWEQHLKRAEIFAQAMKKRPQVNQTPKKALPPEAVDIVSPIPTVSLSPPAAEEAKPQSLILSDPEIITAVGRWFSNNVDPGYWKAICDEARHQVIRHPWPYRRNAISKSLRDLIKETRPATEPSQLSEDYINGNVEWLLGWLLALRTDLNFVFNAIGAGYASALKSAA